MSIKKAFTAVNEFLVANKDKRIKDVMPKLIEMMSAATTAGRIADTVRKNDKGEVTHIFCYYHKKWEDVKVVEYGKKASTASGLSNMCKEGTSAWTKQQSVAKTAKTQLLADVESGKVKPTDITATMTAIEATRVKVVARADKHGEAEKVETAKV